MPRRDGRLLVGATVEERGFDTSLTAGAMLTLLESAWRVIPSIEELPIREMWVGHRPGSRDDAPILGAAPIPGLIYATGHHRNGILLTPITADLIAGLILDGVADPALAPFGIERFALARASGMNNKINEREIMAPTISVNGESEPLIAETLAALMAEKAQQTNRTGIAVAVNGAVVPRTAWEATALRPGDRIEIVRVLQGG